ncbi:hypothetical protein [Rhizomonospora bruguierae]|uniref:hypothetical protein n=1 Tax=Rhizomonospora bruguierae TaxID=1581705 RepID=UPI001BCE8D61|nr:hypothetical protein [Micromonospora sp. NBRC 107566]
MKKLVPLSAAGLILGTLSMGAAPGTAYAAPSKGSPMVANVTMFARTPGNKATGVALERVRAHVDDAMRRNQLISAANLEVWVGEVAGRQFTAILPNGSSLKNAGVVTQAGVDAVGQGVEIEDATPPRLRRCPSATCRE